MADESWREARTMVKIPQHVRSESPISLRSPDSTREFSSIDIQQYSRHLRDSMILIEYQKLAQDPVDGVYVMPSQENIREWHGVLFIREGPMFENGVFRFFLSLPDNYGDPGVFPEVIFLSQIFHPDIQQGGQVNLSDFLNTTDKDEPVKILRLVNYIKRMFSIQPEKYRDKDPRYSANPEAHYLLLTDPSDFLRRTEESVYTALNSWQNYPRGCPIVFSDYNSHHEHLRRKLLSALLKQEKTPEEPLDIVDLISSTVGPLQGFSGRRLSNTE